MSRQGIQTGDVTIEALGIVPIGYGPGAVVPLHGKASNHHVHGALHPNHQVRWTSNSQGGYRGGEGRLPVAFRSHRIPRALRPGPNSRHVNLSRRIRRIFAYWGPDSIDVSGDRGVRRPEGKGRFGAVEPVSEPRMYDFIPRPPFGRIGDHRAVWRETN